MMMQIIPFTDPLLAFQWTTVELITWLVGMALLLVVTGCFVACEFALVKLRYDPLEAREMNRLRSHRWVWRLIDKSDQTARLLRFGRTGCTIAIGLLLLPLIRLVLSRIGLDLAATGWWAVLLALILAIFAHYVFGELIPRALALSDPVRALYASYPVVLVAGVVLWPLMELLRRFKTVINALTRLNVEEDLNPLDVEVQIRALGVDSPVLSKAVRSIITRSFQIQSLTVADILLPRHQVTIFDLDDPVEENLGMARKTGHTRFPLCESDLDHCIGIIHIKDLFRYRGRLDTLDLKRLRRPIVRFREDETLERALQRMLRLKMHMSLVQDEFGGILGVVTLERILEVLVGEIQDEFDAEEDMILRLGPDRYQVSGLTPLHDLEEALNVDLDEQEVATFGGIITSELGHIPEAGERVQIGRLDVTVKETDETRVISAFLTILPDSTEEDD